MGNNVPEKMPLMSMDMAESRESMISKKIDDNRIQFESYICNKSIKPLFLHGDALDVLRSFPDQCIDCCMTSPPYWGKRQYAVEGIGLENDYREFVKDLSEIIFEVKRVLKDTGSFWLNIGDSYNKKQLVGIPWRIAFELTDNQGWILRNEIVWNKVKGGPDNAKDKLGNVHEKIFHFVKKKRVIFTM